MFNCGSIDSATLLEGVGSSEVLVERRLIASPLSPSVSVSVLSSFGQLLLRPTAAQPNCSTLVAEPLLSLSLLVAGSDAEESQRREREAAALPPPPPLSKQHSVGRSAIKPFIIIIRTHLIESRNTQHQGGSAIGLNCHRGSETE